ncbi:MAG: hypothetical protein BWX90_00058 [bacterium ADurb.Bin132]|nr:MAG: hypothetical protein BWX90_00058 [bacterium ADurb.Bin132]
MDKIVNDDRSKVKMIRIDTGLNLFMTYLQ